MIIDNIDKEFENKFEDNELFIDRINKLSEDFFDIDFNSSIKEFAKLALLNALIVRPLI